MQFEDSPCADLYLFGSCLVKDNFNDIDILLVYDSKRIKSEYAQLLFKPMIKKSQSEFSCPLHFMLLSNVECEEIDCIKCEPMSFVSKIKLADDIGEKIRSFADIHFPTRLQTYSLASNLREQHTRPQQSESANA